MKAAPSFATAVCRAKELIAELQVREPSEILIETIAAFKGAPVRYARLTGCDGRLVRSDGAAIITVRESIDRLAQKRFIVAHEVGHLLMHPEIRQVDEVDIAQTRNFSHRQIPEELEANYFAAELLMPHAFFENDMRGLEPSWGSIRSLAQRYQTTYTSTAIQFIRCTKETVFLVASERGERKWFVYGDNCSGFFLSDRTRVHRYSCAHEILTEGGTHSRAANVPAGAWFDRYDPDGRECIVEDSMRANGSPFVLTLLWVRDDI